MEQVSKSTSYQIKSEESKEIPLSAVLISDISWMLIDLNNCCSTTSQARWILEMIRSLDVANPFFYPSALQC